MHRRAVVVEAAGATLVGHAVIKCQEEGDGGLLESEQTPAEALIRVDGTGDGCM